MVIVIESGVMEHRIFCRDVADAAPEEKVGTGHVIQLLGEVFGYHDGFAGIVDLFTAEDTAGGPGN